MYTSVKGALRYRGLLIVTIATRRPGIPREEAATLDAVILPVFLQTEYASHCLLWLHYSLFICTTCVALVPYRSCI